MPYELEERVIKGGEGLHEIVPYVTAAAKQLEKSGADFIVMPCNTLHLLADHIQSSISIPFVSLVTETTEAVAQRKLQQVAMLATAVTRGEDLYNTQLTAAGITLLTPTADQQKQLNAMVVRLTNDDPLASDRTEFQAILASLKARGAECALLACTEFHLLYDPDPDLQAIDTVEVLAQATVREMYA